VIPKFFLEGSKELLDIFNSPDFRTEIHFDRFDLAAASSEEFRVAKWLSVVRLQIVEDKGFVAAIEKLANVDRPGCACCWASNAPDMWHDRCDHRAD
jgi:hypothetical protein